jgi:hypothetical protein
MQCCKLASAEHEKQAVIKQQYGISWPLLLRPDMQVGIVVHAEHTVITASSQDPSSRTKLLV